MIAVAIWAALVAIATAGMLWESSLGEPIDDTVRDVDVDRESP